MTGYAFGLTTPRDFLEKARREVRRLEEGTERGDDVAYLQDTAINAALTLWHISDWIAHSAEQSCVAAIERIRRERAVPKTKNALPILREHIGQDPYMAICGALANGAKHFTLHEQPSLVSSQIFQPQLQVHAPAAPVDLAADVSVGAAVSAAGPRHVAKLRINGVSAPALDVFKAALAYWDKFYAGYGL